MWKVNAYFFKSLILGWLFIWQKITYSEITIVVFIQLVLEGSPLSRKQMTSRISLHFLSDDMNWQRIFISSSVQSLSCVRLFATPWIAAYQASLSITNSQSLLKLMPIKLWCHPAISSSVIPFSSCPQSLPASGSFPMSQLFPWGGQSIGVSASASVLPMNTQDWSPLGWIGWNSLQSKGLSRVFSNTTVQKHQFFSAQPSSQSNSHIPTWPLGKP